MAGGDLLDGRYELGEVIGRGGMSTVHRSYDHRMHRPVAVKVFQPGVELTDADERYRREVMLLAALREPGLVTVLDADLGDGPGADPAYLVTELVDGPTLSRRVKESPLPEPDVARLGATLSRTLAYVHGHGIVHRDVKPANIMLASSADSALGLPKLVDFGIAITADSARLTSADVTLGTANYLSPEQLRGATITPASDIYSLGLVLIEALTGQPSYPGTGMAAAMARLDHPPVIPGSLSRPLRDLLAEMTAADPADRPTAEQAAQRLDALVPPDIAIVGAGPGAEPAAVAEARTAPAQRVDRPIMLPDGADAAVVGAPRSRWWPRPNVLTALGGVVVVALLAMGLLASFATRKPGGPPGSSNLAPPPASSTNHPRSHRPATPQARLAPSPPAGSSAAVVPRPDVRSQPPSPTSGSPTPSSSTPSSSIPAPTTRPGTRTAPTPTPTGTPTPTPTATPSSSAPTSPSATPPSTPPTTSPMSWQALYSSGG